MFNRLNKMARKPALSAVSAVSGELVEGLSRTTVAYDLLRQDLLHGAIPAGQRLAVAALGTRYGLGASPVREALSRLSAEGLVERIDQKGFRVAGLDWSQLAVLTRTRCQVESLALRESIEHRTAAWEDSLAVVVHRLSRTPRSLSSTRYERNPAWEDLHGQFHQLLVANCPSRWLRQFCQSLADEAYRYRQVAASQNHRRRNAHAEHVALFQACSEGRADDAVALLAAHYERTASLTRDPAGKAA